MELTKKNIEEYIGRFMEGETTNAEEQAIYRFFHTGDVPEHLKEYAPMFAWYEDGMQEIPQATEKAVVPKRRTLWRRIPLGIWSAGIAAVVVMAIGTGLLLYSDNREMYNEEWKCYEGSYIEVNGKRIDDLKQIMPLILAEQAEIDQKEKLAEQLIRRMEETEKELEEMENSIK